MEREDIRIPSVHAFRSEPVESGATAFAYLAWARNKVYQKKKKRSIYQAGACITNT